MTNTQNDIIMDNLAEYLHGEGVSMADVLSDDKGYFYFSLDDFTDSEGGQVDMKRIYLPDEFQALNLG